MRWLLGEEIVRTTVFTPRASGVAPAGLQDPQLIIFETESGRLVDVEAFVNARYGYDIRCEVVGETGTLELPRPSTVALRARARRGARAPAHFQQRFGQAYLHELQTWIAAIDAARIPGPASAWDGYAAAAVCEAAVESLETGRPTEVNLGTRAATTAAR